MIFHDTPLNCRECNKEFIFTAGEQDYYLQKGLQNKPARCPECRRQRWEQANTGVTGADQTRAVPQVTEVTCAECGQPTTVPFQPRNNRPVYCKPCYYEKCKIVTPETLRPADKVTV